MKKKSNLECERGHLRLGPIKMRTGRLHTGKCIYWKYVVVAQRWLTFQD